MARATGIQITETDVRVVELDGSVKKHKILGATSQPIETPEGQRPPAEDLGQAARAALKEIKAKREFLVLGLPAKEAIIREIVVPFTDPDQIKKVIKFESEAHLPTANVDDVIIGWYKISEQGPRSRLLIFAVEKDSIRHYLEALARVGIEPSQVDLDCTALFAWTRLQPEFTGEEEEGDPRTQVILDLGDAGSTVMVVKEDGLRLVRAMRLGSESLTRSIAQDLNIERQEARRITSATLHGETLPFATESAVATAEPGTAVSATQLQDDIVKDRHGEFAKRVVNEVRRSLASVQMEGGLGGIHLTGPASASATVERALREAFDVEVRHVDALGSADNDLRNEDGLWIPAPCGLALKAFEHDPVGLEFRQEEFTFARKFERVRWPLIILAFALFGVFAFLSIKEYKRIQSIETRTTFVGQMGDVIVKDFIVDPAAKDDRIRKTMGFANREEAAEIAAEIQGSAPETRNREYLRFLGGDEGPIEHMRVTFGWNFEEGSEPPPETVTTSALERFAQFRSALAAAQEQLKPFTIDSVSVTMEEITFAMKASRTDAFTILRAEFEKLDGYKVASAGSINNEGEWIVYKTCRLEFEREDR